MGTVFILHHDYEPGDDHVKLLGAFSTKQSALAAIRKYRELPGFSEYPDGFTIDEYELDKEEWTEGFISIAEALAMD
jgi:hypothetical protein